MRALVPVLFVSAFASSFAQVPEQAPTFRSEINYVQLPVRVVDARGEFVRGLTQADFHVLEDSRPQKISTFNFVDIPIVPVDSSMPDAPVATLEPIASNEPERVEGRVFVFLLDDLHAEAGLTLKVRNLLSAFIQDGFSANDTAAVVLTSGRRGQNFTRNRRLMLDAVNQFIGEFDAEPRVPNMAERDSQSAIRQIASTAEWMRAIKGRHKALIFVSPSPLCSLAGTGCVDDMRHALQSAVRSDVSIYVVDPAGLNTSLRSRAENSNPNSTLGRDGASYEAPSDAAMRAAFGGMRREWRSILDGAQYLAEETGGFAVVNTNNLAAGFDRIVRDTSAYYLIGYYSTNERADGKFRRHDIKIGRRDARLLHRAGYLAPDGASAGSKVGAASGNARTVREQLQELARSPLPVGGMTMHLAAAPFLGADGKASVAVILEMPSDTLTFTEVGGRYRIGIGLSIGFYDRNGKSLGRDEPNLELNLPVSAGKRMTAQGVRMISRIVVPPGTYRLWAGATHMDGGLRGSVMTEIDVPDFDRQPLAISGLAATTAAAARIYTPRPDQLLDDVLGAPPSARRTFPQAGDLWIYGEIYDHRSNSGAVESTVVVKAADGKVVHQGPLEAAPVQFGYLARLPLGDLAPGSYVATFEARSSSPTAVAASRSISFTVQ